MSIQRWRLMTDGEMMTSDSGNWCEAGPVQARISELETEIAELRPLAALGQSAAQALADTDSPTNLVVKLQHRISELERQAAATNAAIREWIEARAALNKATGWVAHLPRLEAAESALEALSPTAGRDYVPRAELEAAQARISELERQAAAKDAALAFYAEPVNYARIPTPDGHSMEVPVVSDGGRIASAALSPAAGRDWVRREELDRVQAELRSVIAEIQRHQPTGSPPPGGPATLARWVLASVQAEAAAMRPLLEAEYERIQCNEIPYGRKPCVTCEECRKYAAMEAALSGTAGLVLLKELAMLRRFYEAAREGMMADKEGRIEDAESIADVCIGIIGEIDAAKRKE